MAEVPLLYFYQTNEAQTEQKYKHFGQWKTFFSPLTTNLSLIENQKKNNQMLIYLLIYSLLGRGCYDDPS